MENTNELVLQLLQASRPRNSYAQSMANFLGIPVSEITERPRIPLPPAKYERIARILAKRYGVPESLVEALINEVRNEYSDW